MLRNISTGPLGLPSGLSQAEVQAASAAAIAAADIYSTAFTAAADALAAGGITLADINTLIPRPNAGTQRVQGQITGADTEQKVLWGFEGSAYRIYGYRLSVAGLASDVTFCAGEAEDSIAIGPTHHLAVGSALVTGTTEFIGILDTTPDEGVVLRKTAGATLIYEIDFDYIDA